jgi:membrane-associated PAP2 superfamily phosphatase
MPRSALSRPLAWTLISFALLVLWDVSGWDLPLARMAGSPIGFPLRSHWFLVQVLHEGAKVLSWVMVIALLAGIWWPLGFMRALAKRERVQFAASVLVSVIAVSLVKFASHTSCPWDLQVFGGVARHVSHWMWATPDGGPGGCFPAGHASAAFAYLGGYFACRRTQPSVARAWLVGALAAGLVLGVSQQLRGAHYMSHTLWTAWICWTVGLVIDTLLNRFAMHRKARTTHAAMPGLNES